jgi:hypothetical protein
LTKSFLAEENGGNKASKFSTWEMISFYSNAIMTIIRCKIVQTSHHLPEEE